MLKHINIIVSGTVQGVFFRASACTEAKKLRINGFVKNLSNGNVYIEAEGEEEFLQKFIEWCKKGPPNAIVLTTEVSPGEVKNYIGFVIRY